MTEVLIWGRTHTNEHDCLMVQIRDRYPQKAELVFKPVLEIINERSLGGSMKLTMMLMLAPQASGMLINIPQCGVVNTQCVDCLKCLNPVFRVKPEIACVRGFVWEDFVLGTAQCFDCNWNNTDSFYSGEGNPYCDQELNLEAVLLLERVPSFVPGSTIGPGYLPTNSPGIGFGIKAMFSLSDYITLPTEPTELIGYSILLFLVVIIIIILSMWCSMVCCNRRRGCCIIQAGGRAREIELVRG
jgi:hypothetical protein